MFSPSALLWLQVSFPYLLAPGSPAYILLTAYPAGSSTLPQRSQQESSGQSLGLSRKSCIPELIVVYAIIGLGYIATVGVQVDTPQGKSEVL